MSGVLVLNSSAMVNLKLLLDNIREEIKVDQLKDDFTAFSCYAGGCSNVCDGCTGCTSCDGCSGGCSGGFTCG